MSALYKLRTLYSWYRIGVGVVRGLIVWGRPWILSTSRPVKVRRASPSTTVDAGKLPLASIIGLIRPILDTVHVDDVECRIACASEVLRRNYRPWEKQAKALKFGMGKRGCRGRRGCYPRPPAPFGRRTIHGQAGSCRRLHCFDRQL